MGQLQLQGLFSDPSVDTRIKKTDVMLSVMNVQKLIGEKKQCKEEARLP